MSLYSISSSYSSSLSYLHRPPYPKTRMCNSDWTRPVEGPNLLTPPPPPTQSRPGGGPKKDGGGSRREKSGGRT
eukprot:6188884-Pyramimonas_sp.AAC.1